MNFFNKTEKTSLYHIKIHNIDMVDIFFLVLSIFDHILIIWSKAFNFFIKICTNPENKTSIRDIGISCNCMTNSLAVYRKNHYTKIKLVCAVKGYGVKIIKDGVDTCIWKHTNAGWKWN